MTTPRSSSESSYKALVFMAMLSLQFGIQPIMNQKFVSKNIIMSTVIFAQEVAKLIIGVAGISLGKTRWADVASGEFRSFRPMYTIFSGATCENVDVALTLD